MKNTFPLQSIPKFQINQMKSTRSPKEIRIDHYIIREYLGDGAYSTVYRGEEIFTRQQVAAKIIRLPQKSTSTTKIKKIEEQAQILKMANHPNILKIYETIQNEFNYVIITEFIKGLQLFEYLLRYGPMPEILAANIFYQIVCSVKYLHDNGIVHRDIKPENIMIDQNCNIKLIDFGLATNFKKENGDLLTRICGSPSYGAPQILKKQPYDGQKVDIWCLGVVLYVMIQGCLPFDNQINQQRNLKIKYLDWSTPNLSSPFAIQLYRQIFKYSHERINMDELLNSVFFKNYNLSSQQNTPNPPIPQKQKIDQQIVTEVKKILRVNEQDIRLEIQYKNLGPIYSIYNLLQNRNKNYGSCLLRKKCKSIKPRHHTISLNLKKNQNINKKRKKSQIQVQRLQKINFLTPQPKKISNKYIKPILKKQIKNSIKYQLQKQIQFHDGLLTKQKGKMRAGRFLRQHKIDKNNNKLNDLENRSRLIPLLSENPKRMLDWLNQYK